MLSSTFSKFAEVELTAGGAGAATSSTARPLFLQLGPETARLNSALRRSRHAYLHSTVFTKRQRVRVPETPTYLDALLADESLTGGLEPKLSHHHLRTLTITGFPTETFPACSTQLSIARHSAKHSFR